MRKTEHYFNRERGEEKECSGCKMLVSVDDFHSNAAKSDGLSSRCKKCTNNSAKKKQRQQLDEFFALKDKYGALYVKYLRLQEDNVFLRKELENARAATPLTRKT